MKSAPTDQLTVDARLGPDVGDVIATRTSGTRTSGTGKRHPLDTTARLNRPLIPRARRWIRLLARGQLHRGKQSRSKKTITARGQAGFCGVAAGEEELDGRRAKSAAVC